MGLILASQPALWHAGFSGSTVNAGPVRRANVSGIGDRRVCAEPTLPSPNDPDPDNPPLYCQQHGFSVKARWNTSDVAGPALWRYSLALHLASKRGGDTPDRESGRGRRSGGTGPDGERYDGLGRPAAPERRGDNDGVGWGGGNSGCNGYGGPDGDCGGGWSGV